EQNPKAERMNRTLQASGRTQMIQSGLPEVFWPEAIRMATITEKHGVTQAPNTTGPAIPQKLVTDKDVNIGYLCPFGCRVYVTNPPEKRTKTLSEPRSWLGIFLGHEIIGSTYRIWNPST